MKLIDKNALTDWIVNEPSDIDNLNNPLATQYDGAAYRQIEILGHIETMPEVISTVEINDWIPVSEELPEELVPVNITWINRYPEPYYAEIKDKPFTATAVYYGYKWWWWSVICEEILAEYGSSSGDEIDKDIEVTAWRPLPEPYEGVRKHEHKRCEE